jgi:hypothetical protein
MSRSGGLAGIWKSEVGKEGREKNVGESGEVMTGGT